MKKLSCACLTIAVLGLLLSLLACNENTNVEDFEVDPKFEYFPLEVGKYLIYQVDSVVYDTLVNGIVVNETTSFVRERITDTLRDNSGRLVYRIERSYRAQDTLPWEIRDIWVSLRTNDQAERVEENLRFIKMVFPLIDGVSWNGNLFIDETTSIPIAGESVEIFKDWFYEVRGVDQAEQIGDQSYDNITTIVQADSENLIELRFAQEKYARGIGLVYKEMRILDTQKISEATPWENKAQKGFTMIQRLIEHN
ncbi:MAG: hypothetical protein AAF990_26875 [Bacteroidota bacterium]